MSSNILSTVTVTSHLENKGKEISAEEGGKYLQTQAGLSYKKKCSLSISFPILQATAGILNGIEWKSPFV